MQKQKTSSNYIPFIDDHPYLYLPMGLLTEQRYESLSHGAIILYCLMYDKMLFKGTLDGAEDLYIQYPVTEIAKDLRCSVSTAKKYLNELAETHLALVVSGGRGKPNRIYLSHPIV